jgi:hypothetical protein
MKTNLISILSLTNLIYIRERMKRMVQAHGGKIPLSFDYVISAELEAIQTEDIKAIVPGSSENQSASEGEDSAMKNV